jgi:hypothetical protein
VIVLVLRNARKARQLFRVAKVRARACRELWTDGTEDFREPARQESRRARDALVAGLAYRDGGPLEQRKGRLTLVDPE